MDGIRNSPQTSTDVAFEVDKKNMGMTRLHSGNIEVIHVYAGETVGMHSSLEVRCFSSGNKRSSNVFDAFLMFPENQQ
jgi:hypothetical protein